MIEINNLTSFSVDNSSLKRIADQILKEEKKDKYTLSLAFVGPGRMRDLNKKYRKKNRVTDVLAFPESKVIFKQFNSSRLFKTNNLGEIIICLRQVKKQAVRFNSKFERELSRVLIHGILHLLGYDHEKSKKEAEIMREREEYYLSKVKDRSKL